ncbi:ABC-2 type transport system permease protein [Prauserella shujinwangii]|uniref:Transport permease protein n=1 Tax=Prauserella shujinwangii TaxID=1453103 RepID=A0A2T0LT75_9PSEU|nr:ABC transporter permease [Prauserella shujinwangii]PRX46937.1 ABC-2 type transport system permease protein [Prauserella shujinwangii]
MSALARLTATETRLFFREPTIVFFTLAFPPILLVILGLVPAFREPDENGIRMIGLYVPIIIVMSVALFALTSLSQLLATYRDKGVLRRMRTTPVKPRVLLGAQLVMSTVMSVATMLVVLAIGRLAFDVSLPRQLPAYLVAYVLVAVSMFAIGLLVASLAPTGRSASAIGTLLFFPLAFFAGLWVPRATMNDLLRTISDFTPLGAGVQSLQDATAGHGPQLLHLAVMLGWAIVAGGLAARYFRWG